MKFDGSLDSIVAEAYIKFQSYALIWITDRTALRNITIRCLIRYWNRAVIQYKHCTVRMEKLSTLRAICWGIISRRFPS